MASSSKRAREEDISIRVAEGAPLAAESLVLRTLSSCARALPADAQEWDVSGLLLDGQPFSRETVDCWLQCGYSNVYGDTVMDAACTSQLSTVAGLTQVLAFADAVGSYSGVWLHAACSQLQQLRFVVQLPEQTLELPVAGGVYACDPSSDRLLGRYTLQEAAPIGDPLVSSEQCRILQQQVAHQTAALLRLAHTLRLQPLLDVLHQFVLLNTWPGSGRLLCGVAGLVFSDAVLEAALGGSSSSASASNSSSMLSREAYVSSVLSQPCSLTPDAVGHSSLLKPTGPRSFDPSCDLLVFEAVLLRDFAGARAGDVVKVGLDLFGTSTPLSDVGGTMTLQLQGTHKYLKLPAQLLLGFKFLDAAALEAFLAADAAAV